MIQDMPVFDMQFDQIIDQKEVEGSLVFTITGQPRLIMTEAAKAAVLSKELPMSQQTNKKNRIKELMRWEKMGYDTALYKCPHCRKTNKVMVPLQSMIGTTPMLIDYMCYECGKVSKLTFDTDGKLVQPK